VGKIVLDLKIPILITLITISLLTLGTTSVSNRVDADPVSHSNLDENFTITDFGIHNHNPYLNVLGQAGGTLGYWLDDLEFAYMFHTDKGLFSASSTGDPYVSAKNTQKVVEGKTCLKSAHPQGQVLLNGHRLTITGINVNRINRVEADENDVDDVGGNNCVDRIISQKS
jgi:hypothetical protein